MTISNYGITLRQLDESKLELVRNWRNDPKIQQYMEFRDYITPEMQLSWFEKINNDHNYYFIIEYNGQEIGVINLKDIDYEKREGEGGIYIYEDKYLNTDIAYRAHLVMFDYFFGNGEIDTIVSHILDDNTRAIRFCKFLGGIEEPDSKQNYYISKENYINNKNRIRFVKKWDIMNS